MKQQKKYQADPRLDLVFERVVDLLPEQMWAGWTEPEVLKQWFCPRPWSVVDCEIDLVPGGIFRTVMRSPEGQDFPNIGSYLEVIENRKLVWTNALLPGYRPVEIPESTVQFPFTVVLYFEPEGKGTRYTAYALHRDEDSRKKHEAMGFEDGWGIALKQLVDLMHAK